LPPLDLAAPARVDFFLDDARESASPIPFARVEADLLRAIAARSAQHAEAVICRPATDLTARGQDASHIAIACHGVGGPRSPDATAEPGHGVLVTDRSTSSDFRPSHVLSWQGAIHEVFISACVGGRIADTSRGDPLGLVSAMQLRGARAIIAYAEPISDFLAPLLSNLYWFSRFQGLAPHAALQAAKQTLIERRFPEVFVSCARPLYVSAMCRVLEQAAIPDRRADLDAAYWAADSIGDWCLPSALRWTYFGRSECPLLPGAHRGLSRRWCTRRADREEFAQAVAAELFLGHHAWSPRDLASARALCAAALFFGRSD
jgi:CHAT domain-containing protein